MRGAGLLKAVITGVLACPVPAIAADLWAPSPVFADSQDAAIVHAEGLAAGAYLSSIVPPFRAGARDRLAIDLSGQVWLAHRVRVGVSGEWLRESSGAGDVVAGFGDLRLGTDVRVVRVSVVDFHLGWEAKLPNASDEGGLGSDETDILFGAGADVQAGEFGGTLALGLGVLGNPLRFANQDDVPMFRVSGRWTRGMVQVSPRVAVDLGTARNPARAEAGALARVGKRGFIEVGGAAGLTPAAADWSVTLGIGWRAPLPTPRSGE